MIRELIIAIISIVLMAYGTLTGDATGVLLSAIVMIGIGMYSAYHYKGIKNLWYPLGVLGAFIVFMASSVYPGGVICTLFLLAFVGSVLYFSYYTWHAPIAIKSGGQFCSSCGAPIGESAYCPACGAKQ